MKCYEKVECPKCGSDEIGRSGRNENGIQRYRCKNEKCEKKTFVLKYRYKACDTGLGHYRPPEPRTILRELFKYFKKV